MAINRDATLKTAEKLLRQGKIDAAIDQYVRLVEDQPRDWNAINALGDLYVRAGDPDRAAAQFVRIADFLYSEGFYPKAAALYKKALKVRNDDEHTLVRLADIAAQQGLLVDAKVHLRQLAQQRTGRGDAAGAVECLVRLAALDDDDGDAKVAVARAVRPTDGAQAATLLQDAAAAYDKQNRSAEALDVLIEAAALAPEDPELRTRVARALVASGELERAQSFLNAESAGDDPDLLLAVGRMELKAGNAAEGRAILMRVVALAPDRHADVSALAEDLLAAGHVDDAYACVEVLVDAALFEAAYDRAAAVLDGFLRQRSLIPALQKLVEVCVDAGFDDRLAAAQARLADAFLDERRPAEARIIAEDLLARDAGNPAHVQRLTRALRLLGVEDADQAIAEQIDEPVFDLSDLGAPIVADVSGDAAPSEAELDATSESFEVDLSDTLSVIEPARPPVPVQSALRADADGTEPPPDLEDVFRHLRERAASDDHVATAAGLFERAQEHLRRGNTVEAATDLRAAARVPQMRFTASAQLGRLSVSSGDLRGAIEWFERAAGVPSPVADETYAVLYELADALEQVGESARALAVLMEIETDAPGYRDARERIDQLTRQATGAGRKGDRP